MSCFGRSKPRPEISNPIAPVYEKQPNQWEKLEQSKFSTLGQGAEVIPRVSDIVKRQYELRQEDYRDQLKKPKISRVLTESFKAARPELDRRVMAMPQRQENYQDEFKKPQISRVLKDSFKAAKPELDRRVMAMPKRQEDYRDEFQGPQESAVIQETPELNRRIMAIPKTPQRVNAPMDQFFNCPKVVNVNTETTMDFLNTYETVFLAYYHPKDMKSKAFATFYCDSAAKDANAVYAAVDCGKDPAICFSAINSLNPTVRLYSKGKMVNEFSMTEVSQGILPLLSSRVPVPETPETPSCSIKRNSFAAAGGN